MDAQERVMQVMAGEEASHAPGQESFSVRSHRSSCRTSSGAESSASSSGEVILLGSESTSVDEVSDGGCMTAQANCCTADKWLMNEICRTGQIAFDLFTKGKGPKPQQTPHGTYVTAKYWGITLQQLTEVYEEWCDHPLWSDAFTVADIVPKFVKPRTDDTGMGLALFLNNFLPKEVNVMISHAWVENAREFFEDLQEHMHEREVAYICVFSNYQGSPQDITDQLGSDIHKCPFTEVITNPRCQRLLVVPCEKLRENGKGLYSRLWCDWEIKVAADAGLPINITQRNTKEHLLGIGDGASSRNAKCGQPSDEDLIKQAIQDMPPQSRKLTATAILIFSSTAAMLPVILFSWFKTPESWVVGLWTGAGLGAVTLVLKSYWMGPLVRFNAEDNYEILDEVILGVSRGYYKARRGDTLKMFLKFLSVCFFCGVADVAARRFIVDRDFKVLTFHGWIGGPPAVHWLEGAGAGLLLYPSIDINAVGVWTNIIALGHMRYVWTAILAASTLAGGMFGFSMRFHGSSHSFLCSSKTEANRGALLGQIMGLFLMTTLSKNWLHAVGVACMGAWMILTFYLDMWQWRETYMLLLGMVPLHLIIDLSCRQRAAAIVVSACLLAAMLIIGYSTQSLADSVDVPDDPLNLENLTFLENPGGVLETSLNRL